MFPIEWENLSQVVCVRESAPNFFFHIEVPVSEKTADGELIFTRAGLDHFKPKSFMYGSGIF